MTTYAQNSVTWKSAFILSVLLLCSALFGYEGDSDDWEQYRGHNRDGVSHSENLLESWPEDGLSLRWQQAIGDGFSGVVISGDKLYSMYSEDSTEFLACFAESTGEEVWRLAVGEMFVDEFGNGPRSTPAIDGDMIFALGSMGNLFAAHKTSGEELWQVSFTEKYESKVPTRGFSSSPIIDGDKLITDIGGGEGEAIGAFDKRTGENLWTVFNGSPDYTSPIKVTIHNTPQIVFRNMLRKKSGFDFHALALSSDGDIIWQAETSGLVMAMPVFIPPDRLFFSSSNETGIMMQVVQDESGAFSAKELWSKPTMKNHFNSSVLHEGHLYGFSIATLKCIDIETGKVKWAKRGLGKGSLVLTGDRLVILSDKGKLVLAEASPEKFIQISAFQALNGKCWTMPTIVGGNIYVHNQSEMASYKLSK